MRFAITVCVAVFVVRYAAPASLAAQSSITAFEREEAHGLLHSQLPCLGCHELNGEGGRTAPSLTSVGTRRSAAYISDIITDPSRRLPGAAMPKHPMPARVRDLIVRYIGHGATGPDVVALVPDAPPTVARGSSSNISAPRPNGAGLYSKWCASCHGDQGRGDGPNARYLPIPPARHADAKAMSERPDDSLYDVIAAGGLAWGRSARMPAFGATLSDAEIRALVAQIRVFCACQGPVWSRQAHDSASPGRPRGTP